MTRAIPSVKSMIQNAKIWITYTAAAASSVHLKIQTFDILTKD